MKKIIMSALLACSTLLSFSVSAGTEKLVYPHRYAPQEGIVNKIEQNVRQELCLNGYWDFQPVATPKSYRQGAGVAPELPMPTANGWSSTKIKIPSPWNINSYGYRELEGPDHRNYPSYPKEWENCLMGWMKKTVTVPADWAGEDIKLYFEAIAGEAVIYVNGKKIGSNFDLFLPSTFDVTAEAEPGKQIEILVGVRSQKLFEDNSTVGRRILPAGSMWGTHINGIWQDVYLLAVPKVRIDDVYVKPLVSQNRLELELTLSNNTAKAAKVTLDGNVKEWVNLAGSEINTAPVPAWELGVEALALKAEKVEIPANATVKHTISVAVDGKLKFWTPEYPNLYGLTLNINNKKQVLDTKYERFGWREWTLVGTQQCLNGKPYALHSDSWHFQGIPQMTRRYAYAWFKAVKDMNGNAVRPHAQVYPRFYLDVADEMGICVLNETANWASDGGPKLDSELFWKHSLDHLRRFVLRDRNHASVFGWSVSNENKPVILHVYNRPDLMKPQMKAWEEWRDLVRELDPTRPWISSDGEDDGDGILPVTVGHYGDKGSMKNWKAIGKPWGMGEHAMAYYGTPEQVAKYNGERAYVSALGRMEGLANECYNLIKDQRDMGASFSTIFNMAWYGLQPLPLGKRDLTTAPTLEDGIFFGEYVEGVPGVQPERVGPYCTTFNPGYDPQLPLYRPWPLFEALRAANAGTEPQWSEWAVVDKSQYEAPAVEPTAVKYVDVIFVGAADSRLKGVLDEQGVVFSAKAKKPATALYIVDASAVLTAENAAMLKAAMQKGADVWMWGVTPQTVASYAEILPAELKLEELKRSSFLPVQKSWIRGLNPSDFYFCEVQRGDAAQYTMSGRLVEEGEVLLNANRTDWRRWNKRAEEIKTAALLRSENECTAATPVFVRYKNGESELYINTLTEFANSERGFNTLATIIANAGIATQKVEINPNEVFFHRDGELQFPSAVKERLVKDGEGWKLEFFAFSHRPLDDLLIEPNVPKLTLVVKGGSAELAINDKALAAKNSNRHETTFIELPLKQGWNKLTIKIGQNKNNFDGFFRCDNNKEYMPLMKASYINPENK